LRGPPAGRAGFLGAGADAGPRSDGIVLADADPAELKAGDPFLEVEITGADTYDLKGRIAS
jgi:hypothetical protein